MSKPPPFKFTRNASARKAAYIPLALTSPKSACPSCPRLSKVLTKAIERDNASGFGVTRLVKRACVRCAANLGASKTEELQDGEYSEWRKFVERVGPDHTMGAVSRHEVRRALAFVGYGDIQGSPSPRLLSVESWLSLRSYSFTPLEYSCLLMKPAVTSAILRSRSAAGGVVTDEAWEWGQKLPRAYWIWLVWGVYAMFR
jgi:hypothetical protein